MGKVAVVTDSNSGITQAQAKELGIKVMPMPFYIDEKMYYEDIDLTQEAFYEKLKSDCEIKTSMPLVGEVTDAWDALLKEYDEIVYIPMSSGLSSSCATALMLAEEDEYEGKVFVVDNQRISVTQYQSVVQAMELAAQGKSGAEIHDILMRDKLEASIYIMLDTLYYLKKGGRITPAAAALGTLLRLKPVLQIQGEKLDAFAKARTAKLGRKIMIEQIKKDMAERFGDPTGQNVELFVAYSQCEEGVVESWLDEVHAAFPDHKVTATPLSLSVSCHIGPGAIAIACGKKMA